MTLSPTPFQKYMSSYNQIFILPSYSSSSQRWMPLSRTAPPPSQILPPPSQIALDLTGWARWRPTGREDSSYSLIKVTPSLPSPLPPLSLPRLCALIYTRVNFFQRLPIALHRPLILPILSHFLSRHVPCADPVESPVKSPVKSFVVTRLEHPSQVLHLGLSIQPSLALVLALALSIAPQGYKYYY